MRTHKEKKTCHRALEMDLGESKHFLALLDPDADAQFTFQTFAEAEGCESHPTILHGTLEAVAPKLAVQNKAGAGVFVMVNRGDGKGRASENVTDVRAVFVDLDGAPLQPVLNGPIKPTIVVSTSPKRWHCYWPVGDLPLDEFRTIQTALADRFEGDQCVNDLCRVMRLPGFFHLKAEPFLVRLEHPEEAK